MKKLSIFVLSVTGLANAFGKNYTVEHEEMKTLWNVWKKDHSKNYDDEEDPTRLRVFVDNYNRIEKWNADPSNTAFLAINHFADLTEEEFTNKHLGYEAIPHPEGNFVEEEKRFLSQLPSTVDWRAKGAVGPVKNQVHCGGCWSFAATGALEALHHIKTGQLLSFSEQQLLNCDKYSNGCVRGHTDHAFVYTSEYGIELESSDPFTGHSGACNYNAKKASKVNSGHVNIPAKNMNALLNAVVNQPVAIALAGGVDAFRFYRSGVLTSGCPSATTHAVLVVGFTNVNGHQALIVKNSWGSGWGDNGYLYISTDSTANNGYGVCGVLNGPSYPTA